MTGLRQGELLALRWQDIDWSAGRIRVRRSFVRGEFGTRSRAARPGRSRWPMRSPANSNATSSAANKRFKAAAKRAGLQSVRFHDLRHTFGTRMAAVGVPLRTLQEWMGHRDFKTTLIYADYQPNEHEAELVQRAFASRPSGHQPASSVQPPS
jgi:integrase